MKLEESTGVKELLWDDQNYLATADASFVREIDEEKGWTEKRVQRGKDNHFLDRHEGNVVARSACEKLGEASGGPRETIHLSSIQKGI